MTLTLWFAHESNSCRTFFASKSSEDDGTFPWYVRFFFSFFTGNEINARKFTECFVLIAPLVSYLWLWMFRIYSAPPPGPGQSREICMSNFTVKPPMSIQYRNPDDEITIRQECYVVCSLWPYYCYWSHWGRFPGQALLYVTNQLTDDWLDVTEVTRVHYQNTGCFRKDDLPSSFNPRPGRAFSITRPGRGVDATPWRFETKRRSASRKKKQQSIALDEFSRLVVYFFLP